eukprot:5480229-Heterocapsa_arctica.AAC.1
MATSTWDGITTTTTLIATNGNRAVASRRGRKFKPGASIGEESDGTSCSPVSSWEQRPRRMPAITRGM